MMTPYDATHLFVVKAEDKSASIYVCPAGRHRVVASHFHLTKEIVGGGSLYYNEKEGLFLGDYSGEYGSIPRKVAMIFAEQIKEELNKLGLHLDNITLNEKDRNVNDFWK